MKLRRFVSKEELEKLIEEKEIKPKHRFTYFFDVTEDYCEKAPLQIFYLHGVVGRVEVEKDNYATPYHIALDINIHKNKLRQQYANYADPYGGFFDTIRIHEMINEEGYTLDNVKKVRIYKDIFHPKKVFVGTPEDALKYIKENLSHASTDEFILATAIRKSVNTTNSKIST